MKQIILFLAIALSLDAQAVKQTISGNFASAGGASFNGRLTLRLPVQAGLSVCGSAITVPSNTTVTAQIVNGVMTPTAVWPTNCMTPRVPYFVTLYDKQNNQIFTDNWYVPTTVASAIDVAQFIDVKLANAITVAVPNALITNPSGNQQMTQPAGTSMTFHGTYIFDPPLSGGGGGGGGTGVTYAFSLTSATTYTITGVTHTIATPNLIVECRDNAVPAHTFTPAYTVNAATNDVVVTLLAAKSGGACYIK